MVSGENKLHYLPYSVFDAECNMAMDHSLAHLYNQHQTPILRFYGWKPHAISYGYHQKRDEFNLDEIQHANLGIARRPTGGRAILHAAELTYAIILPKSRMSKFELYQKSHAAFRDGIKKFRSDVDLSKKQIKFGDFYKEKKSAVCFAASARFEVGVNDRKMIGSAQRVYADAILQHGSIMLGSKHLDLVHYLNISSDEKQAMRQDIERSTSFLDLDHIQISKEELSERFLDCIVKELGFTSIKTKTFDDFNIEMVPVS